MHGTISRSADKYPPGTMIGDARGAFRIALEQLHGQLRAVRSQQEVRRLVELAVNIARRWCAGEDHDSLAASITAAICS